MERGLIEPVAAVDVDPDALDNAVGSLGLAEEEGFADARPAFAAYSESGFRAVVVPPWAQEDVVDAGSHTTSTSSRRSRSRTR
jgi:hypothetical protein